MADRAARRAGWLALDPPDAIVLDAAGRPAELPESLGLPDAAGDAGEVVVAE